MGPGTLGAGVCVVRRPIPMHNRRVKIETLEFWPKLAAEAPGHRRILAAGATSDERETMTEHPILFSGPMVRAILDDSKTQTRRIIKPQADDRGYRWTFDRMENWHGQRVQGPVYEPGDRLWVRESLVRHDRGIPCRYAADGGPVFRDGETVGWSWERNRLPSIHMPRWASRLLLEVVEVRVERLQDITAADVLAEGVLTDHSRGLVGQHPIEYFDDTTVSVFRDLWDSINSKRAPWSSNPWVWCISFRRVQEAMR